MYDTGQNPLSTVMGEKKGRGISEINKYTIFVLLIFIMSGTERIYYGHCCGVIWEFLLVKFCVKVNMLIFRHPLPNQIISKWYFHFKGSWLT